MKKIILFVLVAFFANGVNAQDCEWAKSAASSYVNSTSITADINGDIITSGTFENIMYFDSDTLIGSGKDIFIVKHDSIGNLIWLKREGGTGTDVAKSSTTDSDGNIIVTGSFWSNTITFGTTTLNITNGVEPDFFVVKYAPDGSVLWAQSAIGMNGEDVGMGATTDKDNNIIITGFFNSATITFGTHTLNNLLYPNRSMFIVKYSPSGTVLWANTTYDGNSSGTSCVADTKKNIIATGWSVYGGFIVKYNSNGNLIWKKNIGTGYTVGNDCTVDLNGNIFVTGQFMNTITIGTDTLTSNYYYYDMFIVKYDSNGNVLWAKDAGGANEDNGTSCSVDKNGDIICTGYFRKDTITFGTTSFINPSGDDIYLVKFNTFGDVLWANKASGTSLDQAKGLCVDKKGNIFITGNCGSNLDLDSIHLNFYIPFVANNCFIAKYNTGLGSVLNTLNHNTSENYVLSPNPTSSVFKVNGASNGVVVNLYNTFGQKLLTSKIENQTALINISNFANGVYVAEIKEGNQTSRIKISKQ